MKRLKITTAMAMIGAVMAVPPWGVVLGLHGIIIQFVGAGLFLTSLIIVLTTSNHLKDNEK